MKPCPDRRAIWPRTGLAATALLAAAALAFWASHRGSLMRDTVENAPSAWPDAPPAELAWTNDAAWAVPARDPVAIAADDAGRLFVGCADGVAIVATDGRLERLLHTPEPVTAVAAADWALALAACSNTVLALSAEGLAKPAWTLPRADAVVTSLAAGSTGVYAADYTAAVVWALLADGTVAGPLTAPDGKRFRLPSPWFDVAADGTSVWVAETGHHTLRRLDPTGREIAHWGRPGMDWPDFAGCCNPAQFCLLPDGALATSEKGLRRIKVLNRDGSLREQVADSALLGADSTPLDLAALPDGRLAALDPESGTVYLFSRLAARRGAADGSP